MRKLIRCLALATALVVCAGTALAQEQDASAAMLTQPQDLPADVTPSPLDTSAPTRRILDGQNPAYPFMDAAEMTEITRISQELMLEMQLLVERYAEEISAEDVFIAWTWRDQLNKLAYQDEWQRLSEDMAAIASAEDFTKLLHTSYIGVNAAPEGEPQPADYLEQARAVLKDAGYDALYITPLLEKVYETDMPCAAFVATEYDKKDFYHSQGCLMLTMDEMGRVTMLQNVYASYDAGYNATEALELTQAQQDALGARAFAFTQTHAAARVNAGNVRMSRVAPVTDTEPIGYCWVGERQAGMDETMGTLMEIGIETGKIYLLITDSSLAYTLLEDVEVLIREGVAPEQIDGYSEGLSAQWKGVE